MAQDSALVPETRLPVSSGILAAYARQACGLGQDTGAVTWNGH